LRLTASSCPGSTHMLAIGGASMHARIPAPTRNLMERSAGRHGQLRSSYSGTWAAPQVPQMSATSWRIMDGTPREAGALTTEVRVLADAQQAAVLEEVEEQARQGARPRRHAQRAQQLHAQLQRAALVQQAAAAGLRAQAAGCHARLQGGGAAKFSDPGWLTTGQGLLPRAHIHKVATLEWSFMSSSISGAWGLLRPCKCPRGAARC
jgi:hypothetical protein